MDFERSTQATHWMFDNQESLNQCREQGVTSQGPPPPQQQQHRQQHSRQGKPTVRKFASGYRNNHNNQTHTKQTTSCDQPRTLSPDGSASGMPSFVPSSPSPSLDFVLATNDQETLVQFHAHQVQRLIGPNAIFPGLRRSAATLSTAIVTFRRFYLSNSVIDFHPRNVAAASALLAVKVDCEDRLDIDLLAHATAVVQFKAQRSPLVRDELRSVSIQEIEEAERSLLQGLNYQLRCHHPYGAIRVLSSEVESFARKLAVAGEEQGHAEEDGRENRDSGCPSPRCVGEVDHRRQKRSASLCQRALAIAQSALVYSDVLFLHAPGKIAVAAVAMALEGAQHDREYIGPIMHTYLKSRFHSKTTEQLVRFESEIADIIASLSKSPSMDLEKHCPVGRHQCKSKHSAKRRAESVRRAFAVASSIRHEKYRQQLATFRAVGIPRKRKHSEDSVWNQTQSRVYSRPKAARVTPVGTPYY